MSRGKQLQLYHPAENAAKLVPTNYIPILLQPVLQICDSDKILV